MTGEEIVEIFRRLREDKKPEPLTPIKLREIFPDRVPRERNLAFKWFGQFFR